jgi:hypothetical protein
MKKTCLFLLVLGLLSSCSRDPSANDLKSPCAAIDSGIFADNPCVKRIPIENNLQQYIISVS